MTDDEYQEWLIDPRRAKYRVLLVELDHTAGTVYLASKAYLSNANIPYDDWIISEPYMEESLTNFLGVGDIEAVNLDPAVDWLTLSFRGHECRWFFGDTSWNKEDFRKIAVTTIAECVANGGNVYQFNLMDNGLKLQQPIVTSDITKTHSVSAAVEWIGNQLDIAIALINVSTAKQGWSVSYDLTETTAIDGVLRKIAVSIGAYLRVDQIGNVEIMIPKATPVVTITEDEISKDSITMSENTPPYKKVTVIKNNDTRVSGETGIDSGALVEEIEIETLLTSTSNANTLLAEKLDQHANSNRVWGVPALGISDMVKVGDTVTINHPELNDTGLVERVARSPLSAASTLEVAV